jgi:hypothetical protein
MPAGFFIWWDLRVYPLGPLMQYSLCRRIMARYSARFAQIIQVGQELLAGERSISLLPLARPRRECRGGQAAIVLSIAGFGRQGDESMKVLSSIVLVLAIVGLTGVAALAQDTPKEAPTAKPLMGAVVKVDGAKVTIKSGRGDAVKETVVVTDDKTVVTIDGKDAKVADLKADLRVAVTPAEGVATKIEAKTPKARTDAPKTEAPATK